MGEIFLSTITFPLYYIYKKRGYWDSKNSTQPIQEVIFTLQGKNTN